MIFLQGIIVNYFSSLDSDELRAMGWCKKILGIICRTLPLIIKLFHFLKLVLVLITSYTTYFEAVPDKPDVAAVNSTIANCNNANFSTTVKLEYNSQKIIYQTVECATTFFTLSCLCICRTFFDITTFCYDPIDKNASGWKKLMKTLGP
jgi:Trk-type K+ transport system membrane component